MSNKVMKIRVITALHFCSLKFVWWQRLFAGCSLLGHAPTHVSIAKYPEREGCPTYMHKDTFIYFTGVNLFTNKLSEACQETKAHSKAEIHADFCH